MEQENYLGILLTKNNTELYIIKYIGEGATSYVYLALDKSKKESRIFRTWLFIFFLQIIQPFSNRPS